MMIFSIFYGVSVITAFYCFVKFFTKTGDNVNILGAAIILLISAIPVLGFIVGVLSYLATFKLPVIFKREE